MPLKAYEEFAQEPLGFPIGGKVYEVPALGFTDGIRLQRIISGEDDSLNDAAPDEAWKLVLGTAFDDMVADKVPMDAIARAGFAALSDFQYGRAAAERVWEGGLDPEALAAAITAANPTQPQGSQRSNGTGAERKTRKRASSTGTTSPKTTTPALAEAKSSQSST